ncbi:bifunctional 2-polyprenyl-6-hydroxyphenol methylase/3-demethylubiquinol 3-O-methyltransferase UbiG [Methanococcoides methylutens]|uniref:Putative methyltransferase n=1 Tax=Methanococcoides methylutens MM1 TaxID=1434104 RepID=A0A0E3STM5_METMT|nr:class I SAM-dependent methyltransferase [Methanococcoides methylutens]AKB86163.1 Putative methyltransferase [Methanococcoides methylutens MM1]
MLDNYATDIKIGKIDRGNFAANVQFLEENGLLKEGSRILEIGCGAGTLTDYLTLKGFDAIGFDTSKILIKVNYSRNSNATTFIGSGDKIPFINSSFDLVISFDVFEHIPDTHEHLSGVRRVLKPYGYYLFQTPNKLTNASFEIIKNRSLTKHKTYHCSLQIFWLVRKLLNSHGFEFKFVKIPVMNDFMEQKIKKGFGFTGICLLRIMNPD